jgi:superfamily I DNA/RNA helicase
VEQIEFARLAQRIPWSQQAILFRTNQQSRPLEVALRQADVRYHLIGGQSYFDRREIKDALAYLKVFINPNDDVSLLRIANVPARGLSDATMERLLAASHERECSVYSAMKREDVLSSFNPKARECVAAFLGLIEHARKKLQSAVPLPLVRWAEQFFSDIGYLDEIRRQEKEPTAAENRIRNLKELLAGLDRDDVASAAPVERFRTFLEELTLDNDLAEEGELHGDAVTLITMHSCKGLEFPHVYIVGLEDGLLPHARSKVEGTVDEERRLLYVAITRAMQTLTLSYCLGRKKYGQVMPCHLSPFLKELPTELVEHADAKGKQPVTVEGGRNLFAGMRAALG